MTRKFYLQVDNDGFLTGLFDTNDRPFPEGGIEGFFEVSENVFSEMFKNQGSRKYVNGEVLTYTSHYSPTPDDVDRERDKRITSGFSFDGSFYQSRQEDRENIAGAATAALAAIVNGAQAGDFRWHGGDNDFIWIAADNSTHPLDAQSTFAMGQAAMKHKQDHIFAARALKDADPIPPDFADDGHWPSA